MKLSITRSAAGARSGFTFTTQPIVALRDASDNLATTSAGQVSLAVSGGATVGGPATVTAVGGVANFTGVGITGTVGTSYTLTYSAPGLTVATQQITLEPFSFGNGTRTVGNQVPPGLYRSLTALNASCYWERLRGFSGALADIIANNLGSGPRLVAIAASDVGFSSSGCATWIEVTGPVGRPNPAANFQTGVYLVGSEVSAGTWRSSGSGTGCYWERLNGFGGVLANIIANDFGPEPASVTILGSDVGFATNGCGTWVKQP